MSYRFDELGWYRFEQLCQALLKARFGLGVEAWGRTHDEGKDAYYGGSLELTAGTVSTGPILFQVKFIEQANSPAVDASAAFAKAVQKEAALVKERLRIRQRARIGSYVMMTNACLTPAAVRDALPPLQEAVGCEPCVWHAADISADLTNYPNIRRAFPQLLGIADLQYLFSEVLAKPILERTQATLDGARHLAKVFVPTEAYRAAWQRIRQYSFVVLSGPPEMGKSAIAKMIGLALAAEGWEYYECYHPVDVLQLYKPDVEQIYVADDAFGSTEFDPSLANEWSRELPSIMTRLDKRHRLVWTSRPVPLQKAYGRIRVAGAGVTWDTAGITVSANRLTRGEKSLILYSHAKDARLSEEGKSIVRLVGADLVTNPHFTPLRIKRLVQKSAIEAMAGEGTSSHSEIRARAIRMIEQTTDEWIQSFNLLPCDHQHLLLAMLDAESPRPTQDELEDATRRLFGDTVESFADVVGELAEQFLSTSETIGGIRHDWMHPSCRDLVIGHLALHSGRRDSFLRRCRLPGILLALSTGGGAQGEILLPLLRDGRDWDNLADNAVRAVAALSQNDLTRLLRALSEVTEVMKVGQEQERVRRVVHQCLSAAAERWKTSAEVISLPLLKMYYDLSVCTLPLAPAPELAATWTAATETMTHAVAYLAMGVLEPEPLLQWFRLAMVIQENDPRFIRAVGFPGSYSYNLAHIVQGTNKYLDEPYDPSSIDEFDTEIDSVETVRVVLDYVAAHDESLRNDVDALQQRIERYYEDLGYRKDDLVEDEDDDDEVTDGCESTVSDGYIDLNKLLRDL